MNKIESDQNDTMKSTKKKSKRKECEDIKKRWIKQCPSCHKNIKYKTQAGLYNNVCRACYHNNRNNVDITKQSRWKVPCSICGKLRIYKWLQHYYRALHKFTRCQSCAKKNQIQSIETRNKRRLLPRTGNFVSYNPKACEIFEEINREFWWSGQHAENIGEKQILQFHLDYYEPNLNLVIEYDEKHHNKPKHRKYDAFRMKLIQKELPGCIFIRLSETQNWREVLK